MFLFSVILYLLLQQLNVFRANIQIWLHSETGVLSSATNLGGRCVPQSSRKVTGGPVQLMHALKCACSPTSRKCGRNVYLASQQHYDSFWALAFCETLEGGKVMLEKKCELHYVGGCFHASVLSQNQNSFCICARLQFTSYVSSHHLIHIWLHLVTAPIAKLFGMFDFEQ